MPVIILNNQPTTPKPVDCTVAVKLAIADRLNQYPYAIDPIFNADDPDPFIPAYLDFFTNPPFYDADGVVITTEAGLIAFLKGGATVVIFSRHSVQSPVTTVISCTSAHTEANLVQYLTTAAIPNSFILLGHYSLDWVLGADRVWRISRFIFRTIKGPLAFTAPPPPPTTA